MKIETIACLKDNYSYIIHDKKHDLVGVIDPSEFEPINFIISRKFNKLDFILNTHHHFDHIGGNSELKKKYNSKIVCSKLDKNRIPDSNILLEDGDIFKFGDNSFEIIFVPGHTSGHIIFYCRKEKLVFTGDTLFSMGCGRIFEGSNKQMFESIKRIKELPSDTKIFCGHEYTKNNLDFCLKHDTSNKELLKKKKFVYDRLAKKLPTIPVTLEDELNTNIFLRCDNNVLKQALNLKDASDQEIFTKLRDLKDSF